MRKYLLTRKSVKDLTNIWNYTVETWSENQADKYYDELLNFCQTLAENPESGKNYSYLFANLKGSSVNKHIVFYRILSENSIEIERILHHHMDLKEQLKK